MSQHLLKFFHAALAGTHIQLARDDLLEEVRNSDCPATNKSFAYRAFELSHWANGDKGEALKCFDM